MNLISEAVMELQPGIRHGRFFMQIVYNIAKPLIEPDFRFGIESAAFFMGEYVLVRSSTCGIYDFNTEA